MSGLCCLQMEQAAQTGAPSSRQLRSIVNNRHRDLDAPMVYQIRLKGHVGSQWTDWFGGATITLEANGETLLTCPVVDQAALHGLLRKVRDVGMPLLSVIRIEPCQSDAPDVQR
jgi:hypothetical protein